MVPSADDIRGEGRTGAPASENPGHLFGYLIGGTVARWTRDEGALADAYAEFLGDVGAELAEGRLQYEKHRASIHEFRQAAVGGRAES